MLLNVSQGYEGSLLKVTSKNGKTASVSQEKALIYANLIIALLLTLFNKNEIQPVGFVTFHTRAGAEAAKQDLQVIYNGSL